MSLARVLSSPLGRRALLHRSTALALAAIATPITSRLAVGQPRFLDYPFGLGVASGNPVADGVVLWTRLAPAPLDGGGMTPEAVPVQWAIASNEGMTDVVQSGTVLAAPEHGHSVHVPVRGLALDRWYFYRFTAGGVASPIGRTRTFPVVGAPKDKMRFAYCSCQNFFQGYFTAYRQMLEDDLDLILTLGDYVYESTWGQQVRWHLPEPYTLDDYRNTHALYKLDADLQRAHAAAPWAMTWDDHEVDNDYAGTNQEDRDPVEAFAQRRAAAYKAYYEHMPLWPTARPVNGSMRLYGNLVFGDLASFALLDNRQYRSDQACQGPSDFGGQQIPLDCAERSDPARSMLGEEQERWLLRGNLVPGGATWKVVAQQMLFSQLRQGDKWWSDGWDGYPATRQRIIDHIAERKVANAVLLGGDIHQFWASDVKRDFDRPESETVATEFVGSSISSGSSGWAEKLLEANPHIRFHDWRKRGYGRAEVTHAGMRMDLVAVESVADPAARASTLKSFMVEAGKPGVQSA